MKKIFLSALSFVMYFCAYSQNLIVQDIQAFGGKGNKISVQWENPKDPQNQITGYKIYRTRSQITSYAQIQKLEAVDEVSSETTGYTDTVNDFNEYFYTVITVTTKPVQIVLLSYNSTVRGAKLKEQYKEPPKEDSISEKLYPEGVLRETPLPSINLSGEMDKKEADFSEATEAKTNSLITKNKTKEKPLTQYIFEEDLISPDGGDDYLLFNILKDYFVQRKYEEAAVQLQRLAGTNINDNTRNRTYFYLGEAQYMMGHYEEAVKTFVKLENVYPVLIKKWLNSSLDRL